MEKIKNCLDKIIELFCIVIMGVMTVLVTWQVITRYVFNNPSIFTEQTSQYLFVWLVMYGSAYVFGKREHMQISFVRDLTSRDSKKSNRYFSRNNNYYICSNGYDLWGIFFSVKTNGASGCGFTNTNGSYIFSNSNKWSICNILCNSQCKSNCLW